MTANQHAVAASAVNLVTTTETVIATMTAFTELQDAQLGQGVVLEGFVNITPGTGTTALVLRVRKGSLTGALVGVAQTVAVTAAVASDVGIAELDAVNAQSNVVYVLTAQQTGASANGTVNRVVFTAEDANAFE